jgi:uncharacterized coiled-coil protein SlyX
MITVRLMGNTVREIIPPEATPVAKWYGEAFAAQCREAPDYVEQRWTYDAETDTWAEPKEPEPDNTPTLEDRITTLESALAETDETAIALYESLESQQETNEAQDEALIELYELVGGE